jgi:ubiquinone/menaquinone biosynthesis C-methylase UbiE
LGSGKLDEQPSREKVAHQSNVTEESLMTTERLPSVQPSTKPVKPYKGMAMEGMIARWYAQNARRDREINTMVNRVRTVLSEASRILEVAPGPGYLAIELAHNGRYEVVGLDISKTFVEIAQANAREAGVNVEFRHGNASAMPFAATTFDFIVCCAAFKNFSEPVQAIREMERVLKPGGQALINDLRHDAALAQIDAHIGEMGLNWLNRLFTKLVFRQTLLKNAYTPAQIRQFVAQTNFGQCEIGEDGIGMEIWLKK